MKKSAEAVSIIEGEDEPTSVFIVERKEKNIFKRFGMYLLNRKNRKKHEKAVKLIVSEEHTMEETIEYMKKRYKAFQAGVSYPHYEECRMNFQLSLIHI